ncbi:hypothetical protein B0T13DRAFT_240821 [Neurospora crassa]|nr:hypothetical protein B0T13DRAFT_240821 [Neurospora crassa]
MVKVGSYGVGLVLAVLALFDSPLSRMLACAHHVWKFKYAIARPAPLMYNHSLVAGCRDDEAPDCHALSDIEVRFKE